MSAKARETIENTLCVNIKTIIDDEFNVRVAKIPAKIYFKDFLKNFIQVIIHFAAIFRIYLFDWKFYFIIKCFNNNIDN